MNGPSTQEASGLEGSVITYPPGSQLPSPLWGDACSTPALSPCIPSTAPRGRRWGNRGWETPRSSPSHKAGKRQSGDLNPRLWDSRGSFPPPPFPPSRPRTRRTEELTVDATEAEQGWMNAQRRPAGPLFAGPGAVPRPRDRDGLPGGREAQSPRRPGGRRRKVCLD